MKKNVFLLAFALSLALVGCASLRREPEYGDDVLERVRLLPKTASEIERILGEPKRLINVEGIGFYGYDEYGFYFDNIVFVYDKGGKERIKGNGAHILAIDCLGKSGLMGIARDRSKADDVVAILGKPARIQRIPSGGEELNPFAGEYYLYPVEENLLGFRVEDGIVRSIVIISKSYSAFH